MNIIKMAILIAAAVIFVTVTNAAPLTTTCMPFLNSTEPYAYCDVITSSLQGDKRLHDLVYTANNVTEAILLVPMCKSEDNKEKVNMCYLKAAKCMLISLLLYIYSFVYQLPATSLINTVQNQIEMSRMIGLMLD